MVNETGGIWGRAEPVPGAIALNKGWLAGLDALSCSSVGNCAAGGHYASIPGTSEQQALVVTEVNGTWGKAQEVPGTAALNVDGIANVAAVSCVAGTCSAAGSYRDGSGRRQVFVTGSQLVTRSGG